MAVVFEPGTRHQLELPGVGPISARPGASQLVYAGRLHSEAAFAALAGANPIPASSGQVTGTG
jgi:transposase